MLPKPIADYFEAANRHDPQGAAAVFSEEATVQDEGQTLQGKAAIARWIVETTDKYRPNAAVLESRPQDGEQLVKARVSGDFPGSPVELHYRFRCQDDRITQLEIR
jgi:hypothetical protein